MKRLKMFLTIFIALAILVPTFAFAERDKFKRRQTFKQAFDVEKAVRGDSYDARCEYSGTSDFQITRAGEIMSNFILVDPSDMAVSNGSWPASYGGSGVTVDLPPVTPKMDNTEITIMNQTGTTGFALYGTAVGTTSGTTHGAVDTTQAIWPDDVGDSITVRAQYNSAVSWYVVDWNIKGVSHSDIVTPSWTTGSGFVITAADGNVWLIDLSLGSSTAGDGDAIGKAAAGVTVYLPQTITQLMDGQPMTFIVAGPKATAGTTNMVLWAGATATSGVSIENSTGVTNDALDADAEGDSITLMPSYAKQIYYYHSSRIQ